MTNKMKTSRLQSWRRKGWEILLLLEVLVSMMTILQDNFINPLQKSDGLPYNVLYSKTLNRHVLALPNDNPLTQTADSHLLPNFHPFYPRLVIPEPHL